MISNNGYIVSNIVFLFTAAFIDQETNFSNRSKHAMLYTICLDLVNFLTFNFCIGISLGNFCNILKENSHKMETTTNQILNNLKNKSDYHDFPYTRSYCGE